MPENGTKTLAPITNVALCLATLETAINRRPHLPGIVAFTGPTGLGKSVAAAHAAIRYRAYFVVCQDTWTRQTLLRKLLTEMSIKPARTLADMADQIIEQLALSGRPLIIDEFDKLVDKRAVEIIRGIFDASNAPILLLGEETLRATLSLWERFHNRVLRWETARPCSAEDARHLVRFYASVSIADDWLAKVVDLVRGNTRRLCVNIDWACEEAERNGWDEVNLSRWGQRELYTGEPSRRRP